MSQKCARGFASGGRGCPGQGASFCWVRGPIRNRLSPSPRRSLDLAGASRSQGLPTGGLQSSRPSVRSHDTTPLRYKLGAPLGRHRRGPAHPHCGRPISRRPFNDRTRGAADGGHRPASDAGRRAPSERRGIMTASAVCPATTRLRRGQRRAGGAQAAFPSRIKTRARSAEGGSLRWTGTSQRERWATKRAMAQQEGSARSGQSVPVSAASDLAEIIRRDRQNLRVSGL
jgi:hypothetical protein